MEQSNKKRGISLRAKVALVFGGLAALVVVNFCLITLANTKLRSEGAKLEISRRNLNLVNEAAFRAAAIVEGHEAYTTPLRNHITEVDQYIDLLKFGGTVEIRSAEVELEPVDESVYAQLEVFTSRWAPYKENLKSILAEANAGGASSAKAEEVLDKIYAQNEVVFKEVQELCSQNIDAYINTQTRIHTIIFVLTLLNIAGLGAGFFLVRNLLIRPLSAIRSTTEHLADGDLNLQVAIKRHDEVGKLGIAINKLVSSLNSSAAFAREIGEGDFSSEFKVAGEKDKLGYALLDMRENLKRVAEQDKIRYWSNEGMARFGEILRNDHGNLKDLSYEIISQLVKYIDANQGALFTLEDTDGDKSLEMQACYAYDRKKFLKKQIAMGEGLAGQAALEQDTIYITEVPDSYANITSGLGGSRPRSILIVPLKVNDEIYGVVEIASLTHIDSYKVEFVEKISENIASSLSSSKVNEQTKQLLDESQELTEQMQAQEEEMRQNMEELQATQEEMARKQRDLAKNEELFKQLTDNVPGVIYQFALDTATGKGSFTYASKASTQLLGIDPDQLINAPDFRSVLAVHPEDVVSFQEKLQESAGKMGFFSWDGRIRKGNGEYIWVNASSSPESQGDGVIRWGGIISSIEKQKELEAKLQQV
ncbi:GAF domain-containing protein [Roseivirga sp. BDSF3-8]|uniref:GAF domain-containing protein n=1 Tax=Roseivirga sp. BDSF3-8 TaxID=3241598 RepID=UPI0035318EFC